METRRAKYTSEEAVRRSRLAVKRRVAAKLERQAQKQKEQEETEQEKKEKIQKVDRYNSTLTVYEKYLICYELLNSI